MLRRGIPDEAIDFVLEHYDQSRPAPPSNAAKPAVIYIGGFERRRLKVYVERDSNPPKIKTAVWEGD
jgi:hypothetical protein